MSLKIGRKGYYKDKTEQGKELEGAGSIWKELIQFGTRKKTGEIVSTYTLKIPVSTLCSC